MVGTGGIGRVMARLGAALGMRMLAWNRSGVPDDLPARATELDDLLAEADVVSIHLSLNEGTRGLIDRRRLGLLKPGALLINTARGAIVDEAALIEALKADASPMPGWTCSRPSRWRPVPARPPAQRHAYRAHAAFATREASERLLHRARDPGRGRAAG